MPMKKVTDQDGQSADIVAGNIEQLKALFPDAFTEGGVNFDVLRQLLGDASVLDEGEEKYGLNWHGKKQARQIALTPSTGTLLPCPEESVDWDTTQNLFIEGDNLEVLKLLQKSYANHFKIIYIDPPYNTGRELIYPDKFQDNLDTYLKYTGQVDSSGAALSSSREVGGKKHTGWLKMMLPRLRLAKRLMHEDGAIFISIDDEEQANLKGICDEIFGQENFVNMISVNMKNVAGASGGGEDKRLKKNIEYLLIYAKNYEGLTPFNNTYDYIPIIDMVEAYREEGKSWKYTTILFDEGAKEYVGSAADGEGNEIKIYRRNNPDIKSIAQVMTLESLSEEQAYTKYASKIFQTAMPQSSIRPRVMEKVDELGVSGDLWSIEYIPRSGRNKGNVYEQFYKGDSFRLFAWLRDVSEEVDGRLYKKEMKGTFWDFASETKNLTKEGNMPFPNGKKPLKMMQRILEMQSDNTSAVLDFFAGSSSMAHAVLAQNKADYGSRSFVMVQLPEPCDEKSELRKLGFETISAVGRERIRRSGLKLREQAENLNLDSGFKAFELSSSSIEQWNPDRNDLEATLLSHKDHLVEGRSEQDVLYELLLKRGIELTVPIEEKEVAGKTIYSIGYGVLFACLDTSITKDEVDAVAGAIAEWHKELQPETDSHVFFRDSAFADDIAKTNMAAILEQNGIAHVRSL